CTAMVELGDPCHYLFKACSIGGGRPARAKPARLLLRAIVSGSPGRPGCPDHHRQRPPRAEAPRGEPRGKSMADDPLSPAFPLAPGARPGDSTPMMGRRAFLGALLVSVFASARPAAAAVEVRKAVYAVRTTLLYGLLRFEVNGLIDETIDRQAGRYEVRV